MKSTTNQNTGQLLAVVYSAVFHPRVPCAYVAMIMLANVFSMAWYKIVMQRSLVPYHGISHLSLVFFWYTRALALLRLTCLPRKYKGLNLG